MKLFKALNLSDELDRLIYHLATGSLVHAKDLKPSGLNDLPLDGWELYDCPLPFSFITTFLGCDEMTDNMGKSLGTVYSFSEKVMTSMPVGVKVKVTIEPA